MNLISRRDFVHALAGASAYRYPQQGGTPQISWHNPQQWGVEGRGWSDTERYYDRLPARAKGLVPDPVWNLSRHSAGMCFRFRTNSSAVHLRMDLMNGNLSMPHMPATGVSGFDLYVRMSGDRWQWAHQAMPTAQHVEGPIITDLARGMKEFVGYLPLYNGVERLEIGVEIGAEFEPAAPGSAKPIVFYGTSICHGACASRPGLAFPAIIGRRVNRPVINLGFSGNGRMDSSVAQLLAELDPSIYVIDCLPNMTPGLVRERTEPLVRLLREKRPNTPILLVEDRTFAQAPIVPSLQRAHTERRAELERAFRRLKSDGIGDLHYLKGDKLLGSDSEGTTDGSHPNDLGMMRYADAYSPLIRRIMLKT